MKLVNEFWRVITNNVFFQYRTTPTAPTTVMIGTTNICNLKCFMCGTKNIHVAKGKMNFELFKRIVNQCKASGVKNITLHTIGEPLLHKELIYQINYAKEHQLHVMFSTNGQLLTPQIIDKLLKTKLDAIRFSVEGTERETYESIRIGGIFKKLISNMNALKKNRDKLGSQLKIFVTSIVMEQTKNEINQFKNVFAPLCDDIYFTFLGNPGDQVLDIKGNMYIKENESVFPCRLLWNTMVINWDGKVSACCLDFNNQLVVGDIMRDSILNIWCNPIMEHYRLLHRQKRLNEMPLCGNCNHEVNSASNLFWLNLKAKLATPFSKLNSHN